MEIPIKWTLDYFEEYIIKKSKLLRTISRFRLSAWNRIRKIRDERFCLKCNMRMIETNFTFHWYILAFKLMILKENTYHIVIGRICVSFRRSCLLSPNIIDYVNAYKYFANKRRNETNEDM